MQTEKIDNLGIIIKTRPSYADINENVEQIIKEFFEKKGFQVIKKNGSPVGIPDFFCKKGIEEFYVEVKKETDSLRVSQIEWIERNFNKFVILFIVKYRPSSKKRRKSPYIFVHNADLE